MLVELAIADAYGGAFENSDADFIKKNNNLEYINHHEHLSLIPTGHYTDDTQMTIAVAEALLSGDDWTMPNIAEHFVRCFKRDERRGYAGRFFNFLLEVKDGDEFMEKIIPDSERSGAAMRTSPLGLLPDIEDIRSKCFTQASTTHNTPAGRYSSLAAALMVYYFKNNVGPKSGLAKWLAETLNVSEAAQKMIVLPWNEYRVRSLGWHCVQAAMRAVMEEHTLSNVLKRSIAFTGDVDTVATIAVSAACWCKDIKQDLPQHLYDKLENGKYGREYLADLDRQLKEKYA